MTTSYLVFLPANQETAHKRRNLKIFEMSHCIGTFLKLFYFGIVICHQMSVLQTLDVSK